MNAVSPAPRSWLFVPGDSERKQAKARASQADALILDLEDSVAASERLAARQRVAEFLIAHAERPSQQLWVRVNALASGELHEDLRAIVAAGPDGIVLPKVSSAREIAEVSRRLAELEAREGHTFGSIRLLVIATETPQAVLTLHEWAAASAADQRLAGLTWGMEDLATALGASGNREADGSLTFTFQLARSICLLAASAAGVQAVDGIHADFRDTEGLAREAGRACRDGFTGKLAIHPDQIAAINAAFSPTSAEVERARKVIAAFAAAPGSGVTSLEGQMLDRPHLVQAQRVLERAERGACKS